MLTATDTCVILIILITIRFRANLMNRKNFLKKTCISGICACSISALLFQNEAIADDNKEQRNKKEDWRIGFSRARYTKLMEILESKLSTEEFNEIIHELGRYCSSTVGFIQDYKGDLDGYLKELKRRWNEDSIVDNEKGIIMIASQERTSCVCPLIDTEKVSDQVCNCSLGWQQQTFETVLGRNVEVKIKESIIRSGKRCVFEIKILT